MILKFVEKNDQEAFLLYLFSSNISFVQISKGQFSLSLIGVNVNETYWYI